MVFVAGLSLMAKKALGPKCHQASIGSILEALNVDAAESSMDVLLLGPSDMKGAAAKGLVNAVANHHPSICVIYICTNDKEAALLPSAKNVKRVKKITGDAINEAISEFYGKDVTAVQAKYDSLADKAQGLGENPPVPKVEPAPVAPPEPAAEPEPVAPPIVEEPVEEPIADPAPTAPVQPTGREVVESVHDIKDWDLFKEQLKRDAIMSEALRESAELAGAHQMMDVWDVKIMEVMSDSHLTNEQKLNAIREFGNNRASLQAGQNARLVDDFTKMLQTVVSVASRIVQDRLEEINSSVASMHVKRDAFLQQVLEGDGDITQKLADYSIELVNIKAQIVDLYAFAYKEASEQIIQRLDEKLPSANAYVNLMFGESAKNFNPANSAALANMMFKGLTDGRMTLTQVQDKVDALLKVMGEIINKQAEELSYRRDVIACLKANHVENVVIRDSILKDCFRVFVGTSGTGLTATVTMFAGMQSRRANTLVVDLTGHAHYDSYGHNVVKLADFQAERIQQPLLYVVGEEKLDPEKLALLMEEVKSRLSYYQELIFVLDASQTEELDQIGREALTITYVTNCTVESLNAISRCYQKSREIPNVGTMLCAIDAPVDATIVVNTLQMDIARTRLVLIPYLRDIRKAAIVHEDPATYGDTLRIFEEAFRV